MVVAPLTSLLRGGPQQLRWTAEAERAFETLKAHFTTAPVLAHPNPSRPFIIEVDASEVGVAAVLSQRTGTPPNLLPCSFYSKQLSPARRNYEVGDRELLAIKEALKAWRHWLEGSKNPFLVWMEHRNLECIRAAKRLNSRQARWALFIARFQFTLSYRPASKNVKADVLSRLYDAEERERRPHHPTLPIPS